MQVKERKFGEILQKERKKRGITQAKLAEMTGFTIRSISYWETGRKDITFTNADIVAKALGATIIIGEK